MPHSYTGNVRVHPEDRTLLEVSHVTIVNRPDGKRVSYPVSTTVPRDSSCRVIADAFGEVARLSILAAMENG